MNLEHSRQIVVNIAVSSSGPQNFVFSTKILCFLSCSRKNVQRGELLLFLDRGCGSSQTLYECFVNSSVNTCERCCLSTVFYRVLWSLQWAERRKIFGLCPFTRADYEASSASTRFCGHGVSKLGQPPLPQKIGGTSRCTICQDIFLRACGERPPPTGTNSAVVCSVDTRENQTKRTLIVKRLQIVYRSWVLKIFLWIACIPVISVAMVSVDLLVFTCLRQVLLNSTRVSLNSSRINCFCGGSVTNSFFQRTNVCKRPCMRCVTPLLRTSTMSHFALSYAQKKICSFAPMKKRKQEETSILSSQWVIWIVNECK